MQEVSLAPFARERPAIACRDRTADLLRAHAVHMDMIAIYGEQLETAIFSFSDPRRKDKLFRKHCRVLKSNDAYRLLAIIWKESAFAADEALAEAGLVRDYQKRPLTAYSLAQELSEKPQHVARLNSRIRTIALVAAAYQLIDRNGVPLADGSGINGNKVILSGTKLLHEFMCQLGAKKRELMTRFADSLAEGANVPRTSDSLLGRDK